MEVWFEIATRPPIDQGKFDGIPPPTEQAPTKGGRLVEDSEEYTFRASRPGRFLGDFMTLENRYLPDNPVKNLRLVGDDNYRHGHVDGATKIAPSDLSLGPFGTLPLDIICGAILPKLDVCSMASFRVINTLSEHLVDSTVDFQLANKFPRLLGATLQLRCTSYSLETLASRVRDPDCCVCGHFGDVFYLITAERWCYHCWIKSDATRPILDYPAELETELLQEVPHVVVPSGRYGAAGLLLVDKPLIVFDRRAYGNRNLAPEPPNSGQTRPKEGRGNEDDERYLVAIRAPYLDPDTGLLEEGVCCRACAYQGWEHHPSITEAQMRVLPYPIWGVPYRRYTSTGMKAHMKEFGRVLQICNGGDEARNEDRVRFVHESPLPRYVKLSDCQADELVRMCGVLSRCRDKSLEFDPLQTFLPQCVDLREVKATQ